MEAQRIATASFLLLWVAAHAAAQHGATAESWRYPSGDAGSTKYSPLEQIDRSNVSQLRILWEWQAVDHGPRPENNLEAVPLFDDGVLYVSTGYSETAAVDPATGKTLWVHTPEEHRTTRTRQASGRGVALWGKGRDKRVFRNSIDGRIFALDAYTGEPIGEFADNGVLDVSRGIFDSYEKDGQLCLDNKPCVPIRERVVDAREGASVWSASPPLVANGVLIVQFSPEGNRGRKEATPGYIRGYDPKTGRRLWVFHTVPQEGELGVDTWLEDSWRYTGHAGVWTMMTADEELGTVYLPVETATHDWYGGHRPGDNLFAESLVCLDIKTGQRIWHYQLIHHGLWDYDPPAPPILADIQVGGRAIKAVVQVTKQGFAYVFDRVTGEPVWPIVEFPVPQSDVPGERTSPTQPMPTRPPAFERQGVRIEDLIDFTPELRAEAMEIAARYRLGPLYTPPSLLEPDGTQGTLALPGYGGGANWPGAALDPETGVLYVPSITVPIIAALDKPDPNRSNFDYIRVGEIHPPGPRGLPLIKPPWGRITAIDLNRGETLWMAPHGTAPKSVREHPDLQGLGLDFSRMGQNGRAGLLVTKTLLFAGEGGGLRGSAVGAGGPMFRAFDKATGEVLAEFELPANATAPAMSYELEGKQYIVVAAGDREKPARLVALGLPD